MTEPMTADDLLTFLRHDTCETHDKCELCKDLRRQSIAMIEGQQKCIAELEREVARLISANEAWHRRISDLSRDNAQLKYALEQSESVFLNQASGADSLLTRADDILSDKREGLDPFIGVGFMQEVVNALRGGQPPFDALKEINEARVIWAMSCPCACDDCRMLDKLILARAGAAVTKSEGPACGAVPSQEVASQDITVSASQKTVESVQAPPSVEAAAPLFCCDKYQNLVCNGACGKSVDDSRDAQRYRWLRNFGHTDLCVVVTDTFKRDTLLFDTDLDSAIDDARAASAPPASYDANGSEVCKPLLHVFQTQGEPCLCGAVPWGKPSNTAVETDEPLWTCDECAGPPRPYSEIERCPMGNCKPVRSVSETDAR